MKKSFGLLIILMLLAVIPMVSSCEKAVCDKSAVNFEEFMSLEEAYDSGVLTREDLLKIADYHNMRFALDEKTDLKIREGAVRYMANYYEENNFVLPKASDFVVDICYGEYDGVYVVGMFFYPNLYGGFFPTADRQEHLVIGGVDFYFNSWGWEIAAFKDNGAYYECLELKDAFEAGWLDQEDIVQIKEKCSKPRTDFPYFADSAVRSLEKAGFSTSDMHCFEPCWFYGDYIGCEVLCVNLYPEDLFGKIKAENGKIIDGVKFNGNTENIVVFKPEQIADGELVSIKEAYEDGLISKSELKTIAYRHNLQIEANSEEVLAVKKMFEDRYSYMGTDQLDFYLGKYGKNYIFNLDYTGAIVDPDIYENADSISDLVDNMYSLNSSVVVVRIDDVLNYLTDDEADKADFFTEDGKPVRFDKKLSFLTAEEAYKADSLTESEYNSVMELYEIQFGDKCYYDILNAKDAIARAERANGKYTNPSEIDIELSYGKFGDCFAICRDNSADSSDTICELDGVKFYCSDLSEIEIWKPVK